MNLMEQTHDHRSPAVEIARRPPHTARVRRAIQLAVGGAGAAVLLAFRPHEGSFYPPCPLYRLTGVYCPGCGMTRALHQLLHGHVTAAFRYNPLLILLMPVFAWLLVRHAASVLRWGRPPPALRPAWGWGLVALALAFGVLRNVPGRPADWLAPHEPPADTCTSDSAPQAENGSPIPPR